MNEGRNHGAIATSLAARLQHSENERHRLAQLNEKKDTALRLLLVMKSVMLRKLGGQRAAAGLFQDASGLPSSSRSQSQAERSTSGRAHHWDYSPPTPSLQSYRFGGGAGSPGVMGQVSLDMRRYQAELSEVFEDEIVQHRKVARDVELVTNDLENMFAIEDYLEADADLRAQLHRNEALQNEIANYSSHSSQYSPSPNGAEARRYNTKRLQESVLEDILEVRQSRQEMAVRLAQARSAAMISTAENETLRRRLHEMEVERNLVLGRFLAGEDHTRNRDALHHRNSDAMRRVGREGREEGEMHVERRKIHHHNQSSSHAAFVRGRRKTMRGRDGLPPRKFRTSYVDESLKSDWNADLMGSDENSISDFMSPSDEDGTPRHKPRGHERGGGGIRHIAYENASNIQVQPGKDNGFQTESLDSPLPDKESEVCVDKEINEDEEEEVEHAEVVVKEIAPPTPSKNADCQTDPLDSPAPVAESFDDEEEEVEDAEVVVKEIAPPTPSKNADCQTELYDSPPPETAEAAVETVPSTPGRDADCQTVVTETALPAEGSAEEANPPVKVKDAVFSNMKAPQDDDSEKVMEESFVFNSGSSLPEVSSLAQEREEPKLQPFKYLFGPQSSDFLSSKEHSLKAEGGETEAKAKKRSKHYSLIRPSPRKRKLSFDSALEKERPTKETKDEASFHEMKSLEQIFLGLDLTGKTQGGNAEALNQDSGVDLQTRESNISEPTSPKVDEEERGKSDESIEEEVQTADSQDDVLDAEGSAVAADGVAVTEIDGAQEDAMPSPSIQESKVEPEAEGETSEESSSTALSESDSDVVPDGSGQGSNAEDEKPNEKTSMSFEDAVYAKLMQRRVKRLSVQLSAEIPSLLDASEKTVGPDASMPAPEQQAGAPGTDQTEDPKLKDDQDELRVLGGKEAARVQDSAVENSLNEEDEPSPSAEDAAKAKRREKKRRQRQRRRKRHQEQKSASKSRPETLESKGHSGVETDSIGGQPNSGLVNSSTRAPETEIAEEESEEAPPVTKKPEPDERHHTDSFKERRERKYMEFLEMRVKVRAMLKLKNGGQADGGAAKDAESRGADDPEGEDGDSRSTTRLNPLVPEKEEVVGNPLIAGPGGEEADEEEIEGPDSSSSLRPPPPAGSVSPISKMRNREQRKMSNPLLGGKVSKRNSKVKRKSVGLIAAAEACSNTMVMSPLYTAVNAVNAVNRARRSSAAGRALSFEDDSEAEHGL